jgi:hypothetical protein
MNRTALFLISTALLSCGGASSSSVDSGSTFTATIAGPDNEVGVLELTVGDAVAKLAAPRAHSAGDHFELTGTVTVGSTETDLTGEIDIDSGEFSVEGGDYSFEGILEDGAITGTYTGPYGSGGFSGVDTTSYEATNYCGSFDGNASGTWNMTVSEGGTLSGVSYGEGGGDAFTEVFTGTVSSGEISVEYECGTEEGSRTEGLAEGSITGGTVSGTWECGSYSGTFEGTSSGC